MTIKRIISGAGSYRGLTFPDGTPVYTLKRKQVASRLAGLGVTFHKDDGRDVMLTKYAEHLQTLATKDDMGALLLLQAWDKTRGQSLNWKSGKALECFL